MNVVFPRGFDPSKTYPAIFEMAGYENGSSSSSGRTITGELSDYIYDNYGYRYEPPLSGDSHEGSSAFRYDDDYISVHASVRGTGCSGGEFDLFSTRSALDGKEIIDGWIAKQSWSNKKVGILGHSYSGITGFMVAATQPKSLVAVTLSGLIDDLYRGITFPGGVSNFGFPVLWTLGIRPAYDVAGGSAQGLARHGGDEIGQQCAKNISTRGRTVLNDPVVQGLADTDNDWWRARSLVSYADRINKPIHITGAYQDEQTGPRFANLWEAVKSPNKRLLMTNGNHGTQVNPDIVWKDRKAWMDYWMRGLPNDYVEPDNTSTSVRALFELRNDGVAQGVKDAVRFPFEDTAFTPYYLSGNGALVKSQSEVSSGADNYSTGVGRQSWSYQAGPTAGSQFTTPSGPDELNYVSQPFAANSALAGPITANLFLATTANDTEMMVSVIDLAPDGSKTYLQRGVLKASHRAIDYASSDYFQAPGSTDKFLYRPFRPHTNPTGVTPFEVNEYLVEVFPVGHIFRPGHKLLVKIHSPSAVDSYYAYLPKHAPAVNTLYYSASQPSRITLPFVPVPVLTGSEPACGSLQAVRCVR